MAEQGAQQVSTVGVKWLRKMVIVMVIVFGIGSWAFYDATIKYPAKGEAFAQWAEWQYLLLLDEESRSLRDPGILTRTAAVSDPVGELARLRADPTVRAARPSMQARFVWLESLSFVGLLKPENTDFDAPAPRERLAELQVMWETQSPPPPLHSYDLPFQWIMLVAGYGFGLYLLYLVARVYATKYRWEPATKALTLPGGATITPADLEEIDKRKWHKFIVTLKIKQGVPKVGGQAIRVDTYRHALVEDWILAMEAEAFPSQEPEAAPSEAAAEESEPTPADEQG